MTYEQYVLVGSTVRSYLSWLKDTGRVEGLIEDNLLLWEAINERSGDPAAARPQMRPHGTAQNERSPGRI